MSAPCVYRWFIFRDGRMERTAIWADVEVIIATDYTALGDAFYGLRSAHHPDDRMLLRPFRRRRWRNPSGQRWITYHETN